MCCTRCKPIHWCVKIPMWYLSVSAEVRPPITHSADIQHVRAHEWTSGSLLWMWERWAIRFYHVGPRARFWPVFDDSKSSAWSISTLMSTDFPTMVARRNAGWSWWLFFKLLAMITLRITCLIIKNPEVVPLNRFCWRNAEKFWICNETGRSWESSRLGS